MTELTSVKSGTVTLSLDDLIRLRGRATNQHAYIDLLIEWGRAAGAEIARLEEETDPIAVAVRVLNDHDMYEEADKLLGRARGD